MNQDGWSLNELLIGLGILAFLLVFSTVVMQAKFKDVNQSLSGNKDTEDGTKAAITYTYGEMETDMVLSATKYMDSHYDMETIKNKTEVTMEALYEVGLYTKIYDPEDSSSKCTGKVTFEKKNHSFSYIPYIKCGQNYETKK